MARAIKTMNGPSFTRKKILPAAVAPLLILMFPLPEKLRLGTAATYCMPSSFSTFTEFSIAGGDHTLSFEMYYNVEKLGVQTE